MSDSLRPHELQHARTPCASPTPRAYPNSCPLSRWCHPTISSSVVPFSSWALVIPNVSNWLHFHPFHSLSSAFPPFLSNCASCDTVSPVPTDSGLLIPFWTGFSLGLLHAQLGSLDSLSMGLMFLTPGSHVYFSHGYPLPSSIIKQTCHLFFVFFFFPASHLQVTF